LFELDNAGETPALQMRVAALHFNRAECRIGHRRLLL